ncbi:MAG: uracil-DNA glycosylase [Gammaproteobacteria bacterium]
MDGVKADHPEYHCRPVAPFGDANPKLLIVGLAPGMHGANASGRPFTGDYAGILLYETLHKYGFGSRPVSEHAGDGLKLRGARITNAVKCLPPENKPTTEEVRNCLGYLRAEIEGLREDAVLLALGSIAHNAVLKCLGEKQSAYRFAHGAVHRLGDGRRLIDSYHCSRYNTNTGRLTEAMFHEVFEQARALIEARD